MSFHDPTFLHLLSWSATHFCCSSIEIIQYSSHCFICAYSVVWHGHIDYVMCYILLARFITHPEWYHCNSLFNETTEIIYYPLYFHIHTYEIFYRIFSATVLYYFFLQQAVTQTRALVATTTVNMTWKAPMYGLQKVAFWYERDRYNDNAHSCSATSFAWLL